MNEAMHHYRVTLDVCGPTDEAEVVREFVEWLTAPGLRMSVDPERRLVVAVAEVRRRGRLRSE